MMTAEYDINAYELNQVTLYAVQGESDSRTIIFNIIEQSGVQIATSNADVENKMLDLTDYTDLRFYIIRPDDEVVYCEGTVTDAENGQVSFVLSADCTEIYGSCDCAVVLTSGTEDLRIVGISLNVAQISIEGSTAVTVPRGTSKDIVVTVYDDSGNIYSLSSGDIIIFGVKASMSDEDYLLKKTSTYINAEGDGYVIAFVPEDTVDLPVGQYLYEVGLKTDSGDYYIIIECSSFTVAATLTGG